MQQINLHNPLSSSDPYIEYLNTILNKSFNPLESILQLSDGVHLHEILSEVSQVQIDTIESQPTTFADNLNNLKTIMKAIQRYWAQELRAQCDHDVEVISVAKNKSIEETKKLVKLVIRTLFHSSNKDEYIQKVLSTSQQTQQFFMHLLNDQNNKIQPHSSKPNQIYDKLLQLENENQQLLQIIQQLQQQNLTLTQKDKEFQDKIDEKERQIKTLKFQINEMNLKTFVQHDNQGDKYQQNLLLDKINQLQQKQKMILQELTKTKTQLQRHKNLQKQFKILNELYEEQKEQNNKLKDQNQLTQMKLTQSLEKLQQIQQKFTQSQTSIQQKSSQIISLQSSITNYQQQLLLKQQLIEQLENNIKYLIETEKEHESINQNKEQSNSIKEQCKQIIQKQHFDKMSQAIILRLKKQNQAYTHELQSSMEAIQKLQKQNQRLKMFEDQNKKLVQMLSHMQKYRGEENQVLIHCLYKMRMKLLGKEIQSQVYTQNSKPLTDINRNY